MDAVSCLVRFAGADTQKQHDTYGYHIGCTICVVPCDRQILHYLWDDLFNWRESLMTR